MRVLHFDQSHLKEDVLGGNRSQHTLDYRWLARPLSSITCSHPNDCHGLCNDLLDSLEMHFITVEEGRVFEVDEGDH